MSVHTRSTFVSAQCGPALQPFPKAAPRGPAQLVCKTTRPCGIRRPRQTSALPSELILELVRHGEMSPERHWAPGSRQSTRFRPGVALFAEYAGETRICRPGEVRRLRLAW